VIVVNYNSAPDLALCVRALLKSREPPLLLVVDNASSEGGLEETIAGYPEARLIRSPENLGFGRGNNLGLRWALSNTGCEFFFLLNNDATVEPDAIEKLEAVMDAYPEAGMAAPRITLSQSPDTLWYGGGHVDWRKGSPAVPGYLGPSDSTLALRGRNVTFASGCAVMIRRSVLEQVGGFDPRLFMYQEDLELCLRVQRAGWTIRYVPEAIVRHKGQGSERKDEGEPFISILSPKSPRLAFYAFHVTKGRLLSMFLHARGMNAVRFLAWFPPYLLYKSLQYARYARYDGIRAVFGGARAFAAVARDPFVDELKEGRT
jgi:GT2 family glycosyltransferase